MRQLFSNVLQTKTAVKFGLNEFWFDVFIEICLTKNEDFILISQQNMNGL